MNKAEERMDFIKNLSKRHIPSLKRFIERQFHNRYILLDNMFFDWQYKDNPSNTYSEYSMKVIESKDEVLGYNGLVPVSMKVFDKNLIACTFANLMVGDKCKGFGLGSLLIKKSSDDFPVCYINGYNLKTRAIYEKQGGWTDMGVLRRFIKILNVNKMESLINKKIPYEDNKLEDIDKNLVKIKEFDDKIHSFWEKVKHKYPITINRSKKFLNWRYSNHPMLKYELYLYIENSKIKGYIIFRIEKFIDEKKDHYKIGRIIDFISQEEYEEKIIQNIISLLHKQNVDFIDFYFSGNFHVKSLLNQGFVENIKYPYNTIPMLFSPLDRGRSDITWIVYFKEYLKDKKECTNPNNWYITKGDGDQDRPNIPPDPEEKNGK